MTLRRVLVVWTSLAGLAWLLAWTVWSGDEANCNEQTSFICFDEKAVALVTVIFVGAVWVAGLVLIGLFAAVIWKVRQISRESGR